ncbi:MAG: hypothetical protein BroJett018_15490 [Chloroflexota bacterium]|nr:hypothetical protein [Chloroflexota bacterium]NOG66139.1 hypothetical protein [Chloroflexota bacterium]GIK63755.1 MAG: hypothetical protein BroJett018_15490 [Chloroflexota bacterium]
MRRIVHRFKFKKEKAGQSIVLLAIGFIALIAFVGLVTDLSLLFVRYSALRRAVDSSAIAAAGQIREGRDYGDVAIAARQYIELHGLEPHRVFVETCETDIAAWRAGTGEWEGNPHPEATFPTLDTMPETELCQWDNPRKLVRVTAQIQSPTTFLRMVGWSDITLEATSVSETAVLDVALVLDSSATMTQDSALDNFNPASPGYRQQHAGNANWIRADCMRTSPDDASYPDPDRLKWSGCCSDPGQGYIRQDIATGNWNIWTDVNGNGTYDGSGEDGVRPLGGNPTAVPDGKYTDLICQPFKQVKDAARNFIRRLDFIRGDRVSLVTFSRTGRILIPWNAGSTDEIMMTSETVATITLNEQMAPSFTVTGSSYWDRYNRCRDLLEPYWDYDPATRTIDGRVSRTDAPASVYPVGAPVNTSLVRAWAYESIAPCPDTNTGSGIFWANNALTNVETIRKDAVWVIIMLSDGGANVTDSPSGSNTLFLPTYGAAGFCPWRTFCNGVIANNALPVHPECPAGNTDTTSPFCNDNSPLTRHFCLQWTNDPATNGSPQAGNPECTQTGNYDADDYARDWADYAGLQEVRPGVEGNFVAIFTIGFSQQVVNSPVAGPLLHYIADAGDNGFIDDDIQQDLRDDGFINSSISPGDRGPCQGITNYRTWCGQYFYADNLQSLDAVFEAIASRLFTRISR